MDRDMNHDSDRRELRCGVFRDLIRFASVVGMLLLVLYLGTGIYTVARHEMGVHRHFGRVVAEAVPPGMHFALPRPFDTVDKAPVREIRRIHLETFAEFGPEAYDFMTFSGLKSYCISGDNNILSIRFVMQYSVVDPRAYLFTAEQPEEILRDIARNAMIHTLATMPVDRILTDGKKAIEDQVRLRSNARLDDMGLGLHVNYVELAGVTPPTSVQNQFDDVVNAKIDSARMINEAQSYRNEKQPQANGEALTLREQAEAYRRRVEAAAEGETCRFLDLLKVYGAMPHRTRIRLWLECIDQCLGRARRKIVVDTNQGQIPVRVKLHQ